MVGFIAAITPICREGNSQIFTFLRKQIVFVFSSTSLPSHYTQSANKQKTQEVTVFSLSSGVFSFKLAKLHVLVFFSFSQPPSLCLEPQCRLGGEQHGRPHDHQKVKGQNGSRGTEAIFSLFTGTEKKTPYTSDKSFMCQSPFFSCFLLETSKISFAENKSLLKLFGKFSHF